MSSSKVSAGLLVWRRRARALEVLLVHPGGPFFAKKDDGWWTIPKGLVGEGEEPLDAARRELEEETGFAAPDASSAYTSLGEVRQKGGKRVVAWSCEGDGDASSIRSNTTRIEWPPRSGRFRAIPEVDRAGWFELDAARVKINAAQSAFLDRLVEALGDRS